MITAKEFVRTGAVWERRAPALKQFTRWANRNLRFYSFNINHPESSIRSDLVAEIGFNLVAVGTDFDLAVSDAQMRLAQLPGGGSTLIPLTMEEEMQAFQIAENLRKYIEKYGEGEPVFRPRLAGCGIIGPAEADLFLGSKIVEVKSVLRGFESSDLRQLITYAVLAYSEGKIFDEVVLVNPKRGCFFSIGFNELSVQIGANSAIDLTANLQDDISNWLTTSG